MISWHLHTQLLDIWIQILTRTAGALCTRHLPSSIFSCFIDEEPKAQMSHNLQDCTHNWRTARSQTSGYSRAHIPNQEAMRPPSSQCKVNIKLLCEQPEPIILLIIALTRGSFYPPLASTSVFRQSHPKCSALTEHTILSSSMLVTVVVCLTYVQIIIPLSDVPYGV